MADKGVAFQEAELFIVDIGSLADFFRAECRRRPRCRLLQTVPGLINNP